MRSKQENKVVRAACRYVNAIRDLDQITNNHQNIPVHQKTLMMDQLGELLMELIESVLDLDEREAPEVDDRQIRLTYENPPWENE